jgi:uncharacterized membrane protein
MSGARSSLIAAVMSLASLCLCALVLLPPALEAGGRDAAATVLRAAFHPLCHQIPERSFMLSGSRLAVCARCTGLYAGFMAGCLAALVLALVRSMPFRPAGRTLLLAAAAPTAIEWLLERSGATAGSSLLRGLTGSLLAFIIAFYFLPALEEIGPEIAREYRRVASPKESSHAEAS